MTDIISETVANIFTGESDHRVQSEKLKAFLVELIASGSDEEAISCNVNKFAEAVVNQESVSMVVSRQFVSDVVTAVEQLTPSIVKRIAIALLATIDPRHISYEEQVAQLRFKLAEIYEMEGDNKEAAKTLMAIPLETGQRNYPPELKMKTYLRIAQLALEYGETADAEAFVNRASMLQNDAKNEQLNVMYKAQYARVLDHRRKFIEAAQRYYELSLITTLTNTEKMHALRSAVACAILASPGVQRSRMLTMLFKDERCERLPSHSVLQKMHLERLIKQSEVCEFEQSLCPHQREINDGFSILQRAVLEHNVIAVSNLFTNITFEQLANVLQVDGKRAEKVTWQMIAEKRISGSIDQVDGLVRFKRKDALLEWDEQIEELCQHVNRVVDMIHDKHGDWTELRIEAGEAVTS